MVVMASVTLIVDAVAPVARLAISLGAGHKATSAVTTKVLNTVRGISVVFVGILFYGEYCATSELLGYSVAIAGFSLYN